MANGHISNYQLTDSILEFDSQFRLNHSHSMLDLSPQLFSSSSEERDIIFGGRGSFLSAGVSADAPFTNENLNRKALSNYKKSSIKNACKYLRIPKTAVKQLLDMQTREKRRLYTSRFRSKQADQVDQLSEDISSLESAKDLLIRERDSLAEEIQFYKQPFPHYHF